jgi:signal transduction histidine kinase
METAFRTKNIQLKKVISTEIPVCVDRNRIMQILINLLSNALKFTPPGGTVSIEVKEEDDKACIIVKDTGVGMPASETAKVFERFYRVDKSRSRKSGGSGLGLTIVKKLVEAHEGTVEIQSNLNEGTRVVIMLSKEKPADCKQEGHGQHTN